MGKIITVGCGIIIMWLMLGCGKTELQQVDLSAMTQQAKAQKACYDARKLNLTGVPKEAIGYAVMAKQNSDLILAVLGKDPCAGTNAFDVQIAEVESKNKAISSGLGSLTDIGMWYIGGEVIKSALGGMNSYNVDGQFNSLGVTNEVDSRNTAIANDASYNTANDSPQDSNVSNFDQVNN